MAYPERLLGDGERIVREMRPHWRVLVGPALVLLVVVPVTSFALATLGSEGWRAGARWAVLAAALVVLAVAVLRPFLDWWTTGYVLTTRRVITRRGLLRRTGRDMPLSRVTNVSFEKSLVDRVLGAGTLVVETASEHGGLVIAHVPDVEEVQREVYTLHEEDDAWRAGRDGDAWDDAPGDDDEADDGRR